MSMSLNRSDFDDQEFEVVTVGNCRYRRPAIEGLDPLGELLAKSGIQGGCIPIKKGKTRRSEFDDDFDNRYDLDRSRISSIGSLNAVVNDLYDSNLTRRRGLNEEDYFEGADFDMGDDWRYDEHDDKYHLYMPVPRIYHKFLVGKERKTITKLQQDSGAEIMIPSYDTSGGHAGPSISYASNTKSASNIATTTAEGIVTVKARTKGAVLSAKGLIEYHVELAESKIPNTHFINIPIGSFNLTTLKKDQNTGKISRVASDITGNYEDGFLFNKETQKWISSCPSQKLTTHVLSEKCFQKSQKLHFTLIMLRLHTEEKVEAVKSIIKDIQKEIDGGGKLREKFNKFQCLLKGLYYMGDEPNQCHVIYTKDARQDVIDYINSICEVLFDKLLQKNVVTRDYLMQQRLLSPDGKADITLHCTVFNTKWSTYGEEDEVTMGGAEDNMDLRAVNAKMLLETFKNHSFGSFEVNEIHFSNLLDTNKTTKYYEKEAVLKLAEHQ